MAFAGTTQKCMACDKTVYLVDKLTADNRIYHKACFRCHHCKGTLKVCVSSTLSYLMPVFLSLCPPTPHYLIHVCNVPNRHAFKIHSQTLVRSEIIELRIRLNNWSKGSKQELSLTNRLLTSFSHHSVKLNSKFLSRYFKFLFLWLFVYKRIVHGFNWSSFQLFEHMVLINVSSSHLMSDLPPVVIHGSGTTYDWSANVYQTIIANS